MLGDERTAGWGRKVESDDPWRGNGLVQGCGMSDRGRRMERVHAGQKMEGEEAGQRALSVSMRAFFDLDTIGMNRGTLTATEDTRHSQEG